MQVGYKKIAVIFMLHFYEVLYRPVVISKMQVSGRPDAANNSFHAAKVSNFYIFGGDEINLEEGARIPLSIKRSLGLLSFLAFFLVFFAQAITLCFHECPAPFLGLGQLGPRWLLL